MVKKRTSVKAEKDIYFVEKFLDYRINEKTQKEEWKVKWKGYSESDSTWEPEENVMVGGDPELRRLMEAAKREKENKATRSSESRASTAAEKLRSPKSSSSQVTSRKSVDEPRGLSESPSVGRRASPNDGKQSMRTLAWHMKRPSQAQAQSSSSEDDEPEVVKKSVAKSPTGSPQRPLFGQPVLCRRTGGSTAVSDLSKVLNDSKDDESADERPVRKRVRTRSLKRTDEDGEKVEEEDDEDDRRDTKKKQQCICAVQHLRSADSGLEAYVMFKNGKEEWRSVDSVKEECPMALVDYLLPRVRFREPSSESRMNGMH